MNADTEHAPRSCVEPELARAAQPIIDALRAQRLTVVTAESCTAGLVAVILSHAKHVGDCFHGGYVAYSKEQKAASLGVDRSLLQASGSVNSEVARQMVLGAMRRASASIAIAVTGVLGPDPDEDGNPAGLVYFAVCRSPGDPVITKQRYANREPDAVRRCAVQHALRLLHHVALEE